jgi:hypothetical protein
VSNIVPVFAPLAIVGPVMTPTPSRNNVIDVGAPKECAYDHLYRPITGAVKTPLVSRPPVPKSFTFSQMVVAGSVDDMAVVTPL